MPIERTPGAARSDGLFRVAVTSLLLGTYLFGLFQILTLPPFEGFDEPAHYSYIQQLALTGASPRPGDPMSADVEEYLKVAPTAGAMGPARSYRDFFAAAPAVQQAGREAVHRRSPDAGPWRPAALANWEAQHPPLYYWLLAPVYRLSERLSFGAQLLLLRAVSYSLAFAGLCLAAFAALRGVRRQPATTPDLLAPLLWPVLLPTWFPEMARLGNDSLVVLLAGLAALLLGRLLDEGGRGLHLAVGIVLGLGLLTKAIFLPLTLASFILLALRTWTHPSQPLRRGVVDMALCAMAVVAIAGWWYVGRALQTGMLLGSNDAITLAHNGGLLAGLRQHGSPGAFLRVFVGFAVSMAWAGTWSFVAPPKTLLFLLIVGWLPLIVAVVRHARRSSLTLFDWLAPLTLALFLAGLLYQSLILIATIGAAAPAWYLHAFLPILWPLLAWAIAGVSAWRITRLIFIAQIVYALVFIALSAAMDVWFYAGCATLQDGSNFFDLASLGTCRPSLVVEHLRLIAFPSAGLYAFAAGYGLLVVGTIAKLRIIVRRPGIVRTGAA